MPTPGSAAGAPEASAVDPAADFVHNVKDFLTSGAFSDITFVVGGKSFPLHRTVLASQSEVFKELLLGNSEEATIAGKTVELQDDEVAPFETMIHFLYHFTWDGSFRKEGTSASVHAVQVYAIANKYDLPALRLNAVRKLETDCDPTSDQQDFIDAIHAIDERTDDETLWGVILPKVKANITKLLDCASFRDLIKEKPHVSLKMLALLDPY